MSMFYLSILLVIASNTLYHIFQKSISGTVNPIVSLVVTYTTALIASIILFFLYPSQMGFFQSFKEINWASYALGGAIIGLEIGVLLTYRAGWNMSVAALVANVCVAIVLIPIGLIFFKEHISLINILGVILSILGIICIHQGT